MTERLDNLLSELAPRGIGGGGRGGDTRLQARKQEDQGGQIPAVRPARWPSGKAPSPTAADPRSNPAFPQ